MYSIGMTNEPKPHRLVANFMTASTPLEQYLHQGGPLTDLQIESVSLTVKNLQLFIDFWKRRHDQKFKI
jgi:hypothetical protein